MLHAYSFPDLSESLLEEFGGVFEEDKTQVMLMSHYRSETPDLIAFSNNWFYGGNLEMYPPARISGIGRRLPYLPNAVYSESDQRNNPTEAQEVIKLIELHVREDLDKSLGVVTMKLMLPCQENCVGWKAVVLGNGATNGCELELYCADCG